MTETNIEENQKPITVKNGDEMPAVQEPDPFSMDTNTIANGAYNSAVLSGLVFANCMIANKLLKTTPPNLGQLDLKDGAKLTLNVFSAKMTKKWLNGHGIIPANIK